MPEAQQEEIRAALDAVYECINTGDDIVAVLSAGNGDYWVRVSKDKMVIFWPYSIEAVDPFLGDIGKWIDPLEFEECAPGETLTLSIGLPRMKVLMAVVDQIFAKVLKLGGAYEVNFTFEQG